MIPSPESREELTEVDRVLTVAVQGLDRETLLAAGENRGSQNARGEYYSGSVSHVYTVTGTTLEP